MTSTDIPQYQRRHQRLLLRGRLSTISSLNVESSLFVTVSEILSHSRQQVEGVPAVGAIIADLQCLQVL